ncbi:MAG: VOC family protein [Oscillospiraceae bacterium]|jgi:catechol 2,3-dioxygenase-like lactoylglutathione lyase family enzyme|nr:VOC family protein [Oscillospiraceae bacterium]
MGQPLLGSEIVIQIGILVHDIDKTSQDYATFFGVEKPPVGMTGVYEDAKTTYMGEPSKARTKQAFFDVGPNIQIELLEPDHEPSTWRHDLDTKGEGVHHIAFKVKGMKQNIALCEGAGMKLLQTGEWATGRYAYMDATPSLKTIIELLEFDNG